MSLENYTFPLRLGRKQKRAILDANGLEVVVFPIGNEDIAALTCKLLNKSRVWEVTDKLMADYPVSKFLHDMYGKEQENDLPLLDGNSCEDLYKDYLPPIHGRFNCRGDYIWPTGEISRKEDLK